jgi:hypothetical protein
LALKGSGEGCHHTAKKNKKPSRLRLGYVLDSVMPATWIGSYIDSENGLTSFAKS